MEEFCSELVDDLNPRLSSLSVIVDEVYFYEKSKNKFLTVVVDKVGGVDLDTVVSVSKVISALLDEIDIDEDNYILDVISKERGEENE